MKGLGDEMSAISGLVSKKSIKGASEIVKKMCDIQAHRGPDGETLVHKNNVCFGHRRLNIARSRKNINEPMFNEDNSILITCDSNIYNAIHLRNELIKKDFRFASDTDSEVILHLYEEFGIKCLDYLRGDFAFALWDRREDKLFLARDRFGIKPLFYSQDKTGTLLFASELKALLKTAMINKGIDFEAIYHYLFLTFFPQPKTPFKFARSVLPGTYLVYDFNRSTIEEVGYWDIPCVDNKPKESEENIIEECGRLLDESVKIRCPQHASIGISLSSGMDSCTIAGLLSKYEPSIKTFTIGFGKEHEKLNEFLLANLVSQKIGSKHYETVLTGKDFLENLPHLVNHIDTPTTGMILPYFFAQKARQEGIDVAFRGDGGNSAFQYLIDSKMPLLDKVLGFISILPQSVKIRIYEETDRLFSGLNTNLRISNQKIDGLLGLLSRYFSFKAGTTNIALMFTRDERQKFFLHKDWLNDPYFEDTNYIVSSYYNGSSKDFYERFNYGDFKVYYDQGLAHLNSMAGAFSMDLRLPYFDHKLIEFIQNMVPTLLREKNGTNKYILKRIANTLLPPEILSRSARGFYMPIDNWLRTILKPVVDDVFSLSTVNKRNIFSYQEIRKVYDQYYLSIEPRISWRKIWAFVILEYWFRAHLD